MWKVLSFLVSEILAHLVVNEVVVEADIVDVHLDEEVEADTEEEVLVEEVEDIDEVVLHLGMVATVEVIPVEEVAGIVEEVHPEVVDIEVIVHLDDMKELVGMHLKERHVKVDMIHVHHDHHVRVDTEDIVMKEQHAHHEKMRTKTNS